EGSAVSFTGSASGGVSPYSYVWSFGDGTSTSGTLNPTHTYPDNGTFSVTLAVTDAAGTTSQSSTSVAVSNVAPSSPSLSLTATAINENGSTTLSGSFTDPGTADSHTVTIVWGDGQSTTLTLAASTLTFSGSHQYLDNPAGQPNGSYTIS